MTLTNGITDLGPSWVEVVTASLSPLEGMMETRTHCAYNQTRECFLGLEVAVASLSPAALAEKMKSLALNSGQGLWFVPCHGLLTFEVPAPLDLIYLDRDCRVLDTVESFPNFRADASRPRPSSILALPAHSIYSSQTQMGDQLVICVADEMEQRLEHLASGRNPVLVEGAALLRESPLWSESPGVLELQTPTLVEDSDISKRHEFGLATPESKPFHVPGNWLQRWWSPDPRKAPRSAEPGLAAYYWNGNLPEPHGVRDISTSGIYVITEDRWYPGTLVLMTLRRTGIGVEATETTVSVLTRAVRWGHDGVGMQFVLKNGKDHPNGQKINGGPNKKDLEKFLHELEKTRQ